MKKISVVVTGATGFVGRTIVKEFMKNDAFEIIEVARNNYPTQNRLIIFDIISNDIQEHVECDYLIHCAALVDSIGEWEDYEKANIFGTKNVLNKFKASKAVIYISTSSVYTDGTNTDLFEEKEPGDKNKLNYYGLSKLLGEEKVRKHTKNHFIIRPHIIYGKGDTTLLPKLKEAVILNRLIIPADGTAKTSLTSVVNLTGFIKYLIEDAKENFGTYNFADKETLSIKQLLKNLSFALNLKNPLFFEFLGNSFFLTVIGLFSKLIRKQPRLNKYLVNSLNHNHILSLDSFKRVFGDYKYTDDWKKYLKFLKSQSTDKY